MKQQGKQVVYRKSSINQGDSHKEQPVQNKYIHSFVTFQKVQKSTISSGKRTYLMQKIAVISRKNMYKASR